MATIKEDYVSFETAKLLKENGFNGECVAYYSIYKDNNASLHRWRNRQNYVNVKNDGYTIVPTLQMAMKWLREVHNIFIQVELYSKYNDYWFELFQNTHRLMIEKREVYDSYEQACEAGIKYCLENLI